MSSCQGLILLSFQTSFLTRVAILFLDSVVNLAAGIQKNREPKRTVARPLRENRGNHHRVAERLPDLPVCEGKDAIMRKLRDFVNRAPLSRYPLFLASASAAAALIRP